MASSKTLSRAQALLAAARRRAAGQTIVFANGAFDLLHVGHARYLQAARALGHWLLVGVNSDRSVAANRPIIPEAERAELVAALEAVDAVILFDEDTPEALIRLLVPDVHAEGTDYSAETVPEREVVASHGGRTVIVGDPKDHATTDVIERIRKTSKS